MQSIMLIGDDNVTRMTVKQLIEDGQMLGVEEIRKAFGVGNEKAYSIIRAIKKESDIFGISGKVHIIDYEIYLKVQVEKGKGYQPKIDIKEVNAK